MENDAKVIVLVSHNSIIEYNFSETLARCGICSLSYLYLSGGPYFLGVNLNYSTEGMAFAWKLDTLGGKDDMERLS